MFIGNASNLINAAKQAADGNDTADYLLKNLVCGAEFYKEHINSVLWGVDGLLMVTT